MGTLVVSPGHGFMDRLSSMPQDSIPADVVIAGAQEHPSRSNWASGIVKQHSRLGMA